MNANERKIIWRLAKAFAELEEGRRLGTHGPIGPCCEDSYIEAVTLLGETDDLEAEDHIASLRSILSGKVADYVSEHSIPGDPREVAIAVLDELSEHYGNMIGGDDVEVHGGVG